MGRLAGSAYRKKASHLIEGDRLWKAGKHADAADHFRKAAAIEEQIVGEMIDDDRDDWVVNGVSLLSCLRKSGQRDKERQALEGFLKELNAERPIVVDERFASYVEKIKNWKVES